MSNPNVNTMVLDAKLKELFALSKLQEAFALLRMTFVEGGCRSPALANAIDHTQLALESAGLDAGPPPEFGDDLTFEDDQAISFLCELN